MVAVAVATLLPLGTLSFSLTQRELMADGEQIYAFDLIIFIKSFVQYLESERKRRCLDVRMRKFACCLIAFDADVLSYELVAQRFCVLNTRFFTNANYHSKTNQKINLNMIMVLKSRKQFDVAHISD